MVARRRGCIERTPLERSLNVQDRRLRCLTWVALLNLEGCVTVYVSASLVTSRMRRFVFRSSAIAVSVQDGMVQFAMKSRSIANRLSGSNLSPQDATLRSENR